MFVKLHPRAALAFYKGQFAKAIFLWTREALSPNTAEETKEARLLSILYTLFHTKSIPGKGQFNSHLKGFWPFLATFVDSSSGLKSS